MEAMTVSMIVVFASSLPRLFSRIDLAISRPPEVVAGFDETCVRNSSTIASAVVPSTDCIRAISEVISATSAWFSMRMIREESRLLIWRMSSAAFWVPDSSFAITTSDLPSSREVCSRRLRVGGR